MSSPRARTVVHHAQLSCEIHVAWGWGGSTTNHVVKIVALHGLDAGDKEALATKFMSAAVDKDSAKNGGGLTVKHTDHCDVLNLLVSKRGYEVPNPPMMREMDGEDNKRHILIFQLFKKVAADGDGDGS